MTNAPTMTIRGPRERLRILKSVGEIEYRGKAFSFENCFVRNRTR
jgi:hypothetical protein